MDRTWTPWSPSGRGPWQDINLLWKTRPSSIDIIIHHSSYKGDHFCQPKMARARLEKPDILWSIHISILVCVCICPWHFSRFALLFPACHLRFLRACHLSQSCVGAPAFLIRLPAEKTLIRAVDIDNVVYIRQSDREHFNACTGLSNSYKAFLRRRLVKAM